MWIPELGAGILCARALHPVSHGHLRDPACSQTVPCQELLDCQTSKNLRQVVILLFLYFLGRKLQQTQIWFVAELQLLLVIEGLCFLCELPGSVLRGFWGGPVGRAGHGPLETGSSGWCFDSSTSVHALWWIPLGFTLASKWPQSSFWSNSSDAWIQRTCSEIKFSFAD